MNSQVYQQLMDVYELMGSENLHGMLLARDIIRKLLDAQVTY